MNSDKFSILSSTLLLCIPMAASAAVVVESTTVDSDLNISSDPNFSIAYTIQDPSTNVLLFATYQDDNGQAMNSLSFGSQSANVLNNAGRISFSYFLNPSQATGLNITGNWSGGNNNNDYFIIELSGVDTAVTPVPVVATYDQNTAPPYPTITTPGNDYFIADLSGRNDWSTDIAPEASSVISQVLYSKDGGGNLGFGTAIAATTGTYQLGWAPPGRSSDGQGEIAYAFASIPEPQTYALFMAGLVAALVIARRRKAA